MDRRRWMFLKSRLVGVSKVVDDVISIIDDNSGQPGSEEAAIIFTAMRTLSKTFEEECSYLEQMI